MRLTWLKTFVSLIMYSNKTCFGGKSPTKNINIGLLWLQKSFAILKNGTKNQAMIQDWWLEFLPAALFASSLTPTAQCEAWDYTRVKLHTNTICLNLGKENDSSYIFYTGQFVLEKEEERRRGRRRRRRLMMMMMIMMIMMMMMMMMMMTVMKTNQMEWPYDSFECLLFWA